MQQINSVEVRTNPSLALVKYWGKQEQGRNIPATSSIAVSLAGLETTTILSRGGYDDTVILDGIAQSPARFKTFFDEARHLYGHELHFQAESGNNFPSAAGLASSSSGFAALALGCAALGSDRGPPPWTGGHPDKTEALEFSGAQLQQISSLARLGSASAARAVYGGWTLLPAGAEAAVPLYTSDFWPEFRILVVVLSVHKKDTSSRSAMEQTRLSSPFYAAWVRDAAKLSQEAGRALAERDLQKLGELARLSYCRMHASALAADPPVLYWLPESLVVQQQCAALRARGIGAWETMDAGPQVKILCDSREIDLIRQTIAEVLPQAGLLEAAVAGAPQACSSGSVLAAAAPTEPVSPGKAATLAESEK
ncbi:MAG: diphosphomevalonate decarboxylase [Spirochaetes bacterium]|nr:diphosphomevalonate decarboxylase [Spirochaetota bacterium]MBU0954418.1 diphosphomevalonate decarboxylase [Spirochaetota bacterium]